MGEINGPVILKGVRYDETNKQTKTNSSIKYYAIRKYSMVKYFLYKIQTRVWHYAAFN